MIVHSLSGFPVLVKHNYLSRIKIVLSSASASEYWNCLSSQNHILVQLCHTAAFTCSMSSNINSKTSLMSLRFYKNNHNTNKEFNCWHANICKQWFSYPFSFPVLTIIMYEFSVWPCPTSNFKIDLIKYYMIQLRHTKTRH